MLSRWCQRPAPLRFLSRVLPVLAVLDAAHPGSPNLDFLDELQQKRNTQPFLVVRVVLCAEEACGNPGILPQIIISK